MEILNHNTHPIFEADQILTSKHLNDVFNYLEEQERMTRAELIGSGIVCGLNISYKNTPEEKSIFISKGIGVTSDGSLMALCNGQAGTGNFDLDDNKEYAYFKTYRDPLVPDDSIQSNDSIYPFFLRGNTQIDLYELHNENEAGFESLDNFLGETGKDLAEFGVLLYLECHDVELKNCIENDCNEKGIERNFILRKLLISKEDLEFIIKKEATELSQNASISDIDDHVNGRYFLETFNLPRLKLSPADVTSQDQFLANYQGYITSALAEMENYLLPNIKYLQPVLRKELSADANFNFLNSFFSTVRSKVPDTDICYVQYLYDFLSDVTETHNELVEAAFELISACCPPLDRFPKHLRLGDLVSEDRCIPTPYRSTFTPSPIHNHGYQQKQKVISLYKKLEAITTSFRIPTELQTIKITPSAALNEPLSKRAIPYYYDLTKDLLKSWNYDHTRKYKSTRNLSYLASSYDTLGVGRTPAHVLNPLNYGLNKCNFFRIEGHVCKNYEVALKEIIGIRDLHNLPFDVITLKLSRDAQGTTFEKAACNFRDLEVL